MEFNPNTIANQNNTAYGLPFTEKDAALIIIPLPWDVTVSYRAGTSTGPAKVIESSYQVDLYDADAPDQWKSGIYTCEIPEFVHQKSIQAREIAEQAIELLESGHSEEEAHVKELLDQVNIQSAEFNDWVRQETEKYLSQGKLVGLLGGDHSTPLEYIKHMSSRYSDLSILQIDAHMDLRKAYEGFTYSHASIMYNVLNEAADVAKIVQLGVRDYCDEELELMQHNAKISCYMDADIRREMYRGAQLEAIWDRVLDDLTDHVYISWDIDGLRPELCPNTGTPVPGGFDCEELYFLVNKIVDSGKKIVGFDLNEVSGDEDNHSIDSIVGARILYKLANLSLKSNGK